MAFEEQRIPTNILYSSTGGPKFLNYITGSESGHEQRNAIWQIARHNFIINYIKQKGDRGLMMDFFNAMRGSLHGFRFKDHNDYKSVYSHLATAFDDIAIGVGDGIETEFQLTKPYPMGGQTYVRDILKPVAGTVKMGIDGVEKFSPADWSVDTVTGLVTFVVAPADTLVISAGYEFDVPVRFNTDFLDMQNLFVDTGQISLPITEIKDPFT